MVCRACLAAATVPLQTWEGLGIPSHSTCRASAIARNKETWCRLDAVSAVGQQ